MKPERLKIQAFGSFADEQVIDFTQFGDHPMILINGPTGAGKSTILDAICFALYGKTSADDRDASHMRAQYADASSLSVIEFDFSLGNTRYRIRRVPQQKRPKKRGEGETDHNAEAQVWKFNGEVADVVVNRGMTQATEYIETLMGLNADQFRQVMVLPQGRFRELLVAKSTDREKIFSTLFNSAIYKRIEDSLKAQAKVIQNQVQSSMDQAAGKLKLVDMENERELNDAIALLEPQVLQLDRNRTHANEQLARASKSLEQAENLVKVFKTAEQLKHKLAQLQTDGNALTPKRVQIQKALAAIRLLPLFQAVESAEKTVESREQSIQEQTVLLSTAAQQEQQAKELLQTLATRIKSSEGDKKQLAELEALLIRHDALSPRQSAVENAEIKFKQAELVHKNVLGALADKKEELKKLDEVLTRDRQAIEKLNEAELSLGALSQLVEARKVYDQYQVDFNAMKKRIADQNPVLKTLSQSVEQSTKAVSELELKWHLGAAAALAAELQSDTPCPVCGSTEHPQLASADDEHGLVDQAQVEQARSALENVRKQHQEEQTRLDRWQEESDRLARFIKEFVDSNPESTEETLKSLQQRYQHQRSNCDKFRSIKATIPTTENKFQSVRKELSTLEEEVIKAVAGQSESAALLKSSTQEYQDALQAVPVEFRNKTALQKKIDTLRASLEKLAHEHTESENRLQAVSLDVAKYTSVLESAKKELKNEREMLTSRLTAANTQLADSEFSDLDEYEKFLLTEEEIGTLRKEVDEHEKLVHKTQGELDATLKTLESKKLPDISALSTIVSEASNLATSAQQQWQLQRDCLKRYTDVRASINENLAATEKLRTEYETIGRLSSVANGQSETRISLQRFVLSVLLDDVLIDASRRMLVMSRNRYQLVRREASGGRVAAGLELDVFDTYSGKTRPVSTLSGGESFQAALSLALGLSDVVQSYSGGIRLDTLFIDEGFGSLDTEALELAIKTLTDLQSAGRTIGVISHVTEMKEQIAQRLDIRPSPSGSRIQAVT